MIDIRSLRNESTLLPGKPVDKIVFRNGRPKGMSMVAVDTPEYAIYLQTINHGEFYELLVWVDHE